MKRAGVLGALVVALGALVPVNAVDAGPLKQPCNATDWPTFGRDIGRAFASPDGCITKLTAPTLRPVWFLNTKSPVTAQPAVVDGVLYAGTFDGHFFAVNANDGTKKWVFDVTRYDRSPHDFGVIPGSAAVTTIGNRKVVIFGGGATVFVLDANNGALVAKQCLDRTDPTCQGQVAATMEIESSPAVVPQPDGSVQILVGSDANEDNPSGPAGLWSLTLRPDGTLVPHWMFNPETGITHAGLPPLDPQQSEHGCNGVWSSPAVDLVTRTVVFGVGNCNHPDEIENSTVALVESTLALDLDTGAVRWQATPNPIDNGWDFDFGATPNILGSSVGEGGKDGRYYVYDLATGQEQWRAQLATGSSLGGMIGSTAVGRLSNGHPAVFAATAIPVSPNDPEGSIRNDIENPQQAFGVHAVDLVTHEVLWHTPVGPVFGAAVFNNGVVYVPVTTNDSLVLIDADTGVILRVQPLNAPPSSPVAIVGNRVYMGSGTTEGTPPLSAIAALGGLWGFQAGGG